MCSALRPQKQKTCFPSIFDYKNLKLVNVEEDWNNGRSASRRNTVNSQYIKGKYTYNTSFQSQDPCLIYDIFEIKGTENVVTCVSIVPVDYSLQTFDCKNYE